MPASSLEGFSTSPTTSKRLVGLCCRHSGTAVIDRQPARTHGSLGVDGLGISFVAIRGRRGGRRAACPFGFELPKRRA